MSHGITEQDSMMSVKLMPWHRRKECVILEEAPKTALAALSASGLGWGVEQEPAYRRVELPDPDDPSQVFEMFVPIKDADDTEWQLNYRSDTGAVLGVVTLDYKPVQNIDAFRFLDGLMQGDADELALYKQLGFAVPDGPAIEWETAGSLQGGKRVWVLAKIPTDVEFAGDKVQPYLYVANSHDGSMAVTASATAVRIVCGNTLGMALRYSEQGAQAASTFRFRHTGNLDAKLAEARKVLGMQLKWTAQMKALADKLGLINLSDKKATNLVKSLTPVRIEEGMTDRKVANRTKIVDAIMSIYKGEGQQGDTRGEAPGTAWTLFNAVAEHADYGRRYTVRTSQVSRSFEDGGLKQEALDKVMALA